MSSFLVEYATWGFAMMVLSALTSLLRVRQTIDLLRKKKYILFGAQIMTGLLALLLWPATLLWVCYVIIFTRE